MLVCNWRYLGLESFTLSKFSQFNSWDDNHATRCVKFVWVFLSKDSFWHWAYLSRVNSVCEKVYCIRCLFYFQCSTVNIYKYKGKYVLRRIPRASDGWKLLSLSWINKVTSSMGIYQLRYDALRFSLTQVSLLQFFSHTKELIII